jgi:hypothetical protein
MDFQSPRSPTRATVLALVGAAFLLVTLVLPAEYGIDPTGIGRLTGLKAMGDDKVAAARAHSAAPVAAPAAAKAGDVPYDTQSARALRTDSVDVTLAPNAEIEYKAILAEGDPIVFDWDAGGAEVRFDFHGEPSAGPSGMFLTYRKGAAAKAAGSLRAPFAGTHGWYWKNPTAQSVVIKLRVTGFHSELKRL